MVEYFLVFAILVLFVGLCHAALALETRRMGLDDEDDPERRP